MIAKIRIDSDGDIFFYNERRLLHRRDRQYLSRHRLDGPAIEYTDGQKEWWMNGKRHRLDGPAFEYCNGNKQWFINNVEYTEEEFNKIVGGLC